jgi:hypothetical protein
LHCHLGKFGDDLIELLLAGRLLQSADRWNHQQRDHTRHLLAHLLGLLRCHLLQRLLPFPDHRLPLLGHRLGDPPTLNLGQFHRRLRLAGIGQVQHGASGDFLSDSVLNAAGGKGQSQLGIRRERSLEAVQLLGDVGQVSPCQLPGGKLFPLSRVQ